MPAEADVTPVSGAPFLGEPVAYELAAVGYSNEEHFLAGTARSYAASPDEAPYRTRAIVRKPLDPARFNGTVVVEWLNVSGGVDAGPDWSFTHRHLMREGAAWVGVSAQRVGIEGGGFAARGIGDPCQRCGKCRSSTDQRQEGFGDSGTGGWPKDLLESGT